MRLFVVSDSHGDLFTLETILRRAADFDAVVHLGDGAADLSVLRDLTEDKTVIRIRGNCDSPACGAENKAVFTTPDGATVFACHGHAYGVKYSMTRLSLAAAENGASLCLFGHTHVPFCENADGAWFLNPGAARDGRYAIVETKHGKCYPVLLSL